MIVINGWVNWKLVINDLTDLDDEVKLYVNFGKIITFFKLTNVVWIIISVSKPI